MRTRLPKVSVSTMSLAGESSRSKERGRSEGLCDGAGAVMEIPEMPDAGHCGLTPGREVTGLGRALKSEHEVKSQS